MNIYWLIPTLSSLPIQFSQILRVKPEWCNLKSKICVLSKTPKYPNPKYMTIIKIKQMYPMYYFRQTSNQKCKPNQNQLPMATISSFETKQGHSGQSPSGPKRHTVQNPSCVGSPAPTSPEMARESHTLSSRRAAHSTLFCSLATLDFGSWLSFFCCCILCRTYSFCTTSHPDEGAVNFSQKRSSAKVDLLYYLPYYICIEKY